MYAVVKTGGKQYRVSKDDTIMVEFIKAETGSTIYLDNVMMLNNNGDLTIGTPKVDGALVSAKVVKQARGPKLIIFRRKRRKNHRRTQGHRQDLTLLKIIDISPDGKIKASNKKTQLEGDKENKSTTKEAVAKKSIKKQTIKKASSTKATTKKLAAKKATAKKTPSVKK